MSLASRYLDVISKLAPTGAAGISLLLASTAPSGAHETPAGVTMPPEPVSARLAAIRDAVSAFASTENETAAPTGTERRLAWGNWNNWRWRAFPSPVWPWSNWNNWRNWNNWGNFWRNW
ncbi:MAG TPA: hypothetical protein VLX09_16235 [Stellaceae bacterium]|nr:hypothetical protein [Stellaceae bacterium]